jgi:phosphohistidine phosphatase
MKNILIMRHAKSDWGAGQKDFERPLNKRGEEAALFMGEYLRKLNKIPDLIISSPAERAKSTTFFVKSSLNYKGKILWNPNYYYGDESNMLDSLYELDNDIDCVLLVGHNPTVENFVTNLTTIFSQMSTANIVSIIANIDSWSNLKLYDNQLEWHLRPKNLME